MHDRNLSELRISPYRLGIWKRGTWIKSVFLPETNFGDLDINGFVVVGRYDVEDWVCVTWKNRCVVLRIFG